MALPPLRLLSVSPRYPLHQIGMEEWAVEAVGSLVCLRHEVRLSWHRSWRRRKALILSTPLLSLLPELACVWIQLSRTNVCFPADVCRVVCPPLRLQAAGLDPSDCGMPGALPCQDIYVMYILAERKPTYFLQARRPLMVFPPGGRTTTCSASTGAVFHA